MNSSMYIQYVIVVELLVIMGMIYPVFYSAIVAVYRGKNGIHKATLILTVFCEFFLSSCIYFIYVHLSTYPLGNTIVFWLLCISLAGCIVGLDAISVALTKAEIDRNKQSNRRIRNFLLDKLMEDD